MRNAVLVLVTFACIACESGASLGVPCARDAECSAPLTCRFGRCRAQCVEGRDCPAGQVCLAVGGGGACELPDIDVCAMTCEAPLICASGHCRQACTAPSDCPVDHQCRTGACERTSGSDAGAPTSDAARAWACDPVVNDGCPTGRRCGLILGAPTCVASVASSAGVGAHCSTEADCGAALSCQSARCQRVCYDGTDAGCGPDAICATWVISSSDQLAPGLGYCSEVCDPLGGGLRCAPGQTCNVGVSDHGPFTLCLGDAAASEGDACGPDAICRDGLQCGYGDDHCRAFCDPTATSPCPPDRHCSATFTFESGRSIGVCRP